MVREPKQYHPQRVMEEWAMNCSALQYSVDPIECWRRHCESQLAKHLQTQVIMRSVDSEFDHEFRGEQTYLLCELQTTFEDRVFTCPIYGTKQEFGDFIYKCEWVNKLGWVALLSPSQQSNVCHYHQVKNFVQHLMVGSSWPGMRTIWLRW